IWSLTYEEEYTCPLYVTASRGYSDCLQLLLRKGADVDFAPGGENALHGACQHGHSECVRLLLRHGANPNVESQDGALPLHYCKTPESYQCAKLLLQHGAHINSPLVSPSPRISVPSCAKLLLQHGAHINSPLVSPSPRISVPSYLRPHVSPSPRISVPSHLRPVDLRPLASPSPRVLRYCYTSPRTVEVLLNTYSKLRGTEDWAEVVPEEEQQNHLQFFQSVFSLSRSPRSLQHLCRCALRSHLEGRMSQTLPKLPLPPALLEFLQLRFEDVLY
ncbi:PREDICTED: ankyrin repeat and SOCS box protein 10-like, partial [Nanorana parkeri]|uniref:ankyrin repeat and SOCS box protein 10-like n=1 Tax=Nanorana parkeri TaxID=125878 RepID=UPI000854624E